MANFAFVDVAGNTYQAAAPAHAEDSKISFATAAYIASLPGPKTFNPYYSPTRVGSRTGLPPGNGVAANPGQSAFDSMPGPGNYQTGLMFDVDSLFRADGVSAPAILLARGHEANWYVPGNSGEGFKSVSLVSSRAIESEGLVKLEFGPSSTALSRDGLPTFSFDTPASGINSFKATPGIAGAPAVLSVISGETNAGLGLLPAGGYAVTTNKLFVGPQSSWAGAQSGNLTRPRTQFAVFVSNFANVGGTDFYPQTSVSAGAQTGSVISGTRSWYNTFTVDQDNISVVATSGSPQGLSMIYAGVGVGNSNGSDGGAAAGGRNGIDANVFINSNIDIGPGSLFHVAVAGNTSATYRMGGVPGAFRGNIFGALLAARGFDKAGAGARYLNSIVGLEVDVEQQANVSNLWKIAAQFVEEKDSAANATQQNIGLGMINQPSASTIGWEQIFSLGGFNGQFPGAPHGQVMATLPNAPGASSTFEIADGINFATRLVFSRSPFSSPNFYVGATGNTGANAFSGKFLQTMSEINAKVSTVGTVTIIEPGSYDGDAVPVKPTFNVAASPLGGVNSTLTVTNMSVVDFMGVVTGGTGYAPGDLLTQDGGTSGGVAATRMVLYVETVNGSGQPVNVRIATPGDYTTQFNNPATFTTGGAGNGYTASFRWGVLAATATPGTLYNELMPPEVTLNTGLMHKEARFRLNMTAGTAVKLLLNAGVDRPIAFTGQTSSAAAAAGTLLNAPVAGNPAHWQKIVINGVNYTFPCWLG